jgi:hypothetical protein
LVDGEIRFGDLNFKKVLPSGQMKSARFGEGPRSLFEEIGDVFRGEGLEEAGILDSPVDGMLAIDFTEGDDLLEVMAGVEAALFQFTVIIPGFVWEVEEAHEEFLIPSLGSVLDQTFGMVGVFIVFVSIISADMAGDEILLMIDTNAIRVDSQAEFGAGIAVWNGIGVGVDFDAELRGSAELNGRADIVRVRGKGCRKPE